MSTHTTNAIVQTSKLIALGDAIRAKTGSSAEMTIDEMATAVANIPTGGGSVQANVYEGVIFVDYDGSYVDYWAPADVAGKTALPGSPSHTGLTAQGWNWTLAQIKAQILAYPSMPVWVGQMYVTASGATEVDISLTDSEFLSPYLGVSINGTLTIDWGDNSPTETLSGSSVKSPKYQRHTYQSVGNYTIKLIANGSLGLYEVSNSYASLLIQSNSTSRKSGRAYSNCVTAIRLGPSVSIGQDAVSSNYSLRSITIPNDVTSVGTYSFYYCKSLRSITFPNSLTSLGSYTFVGCESLQSISIPSEITAIPTRLAQNCYTLPSITIPSGVTSIGDSAFYGCNALRSLVIPNNVTSIGTSAVSQSIGLRSVTIPGGITRISDTVFYGCNSLHSITIPSGVTSIGRNSLSNLYSVTSITIPAQVTSIGDSAFYNNYSAEEYHFLPTNPPTLGSSAFSGIVSGTKIYVPSASLSDYKTAANWSSYASYIVGE